MAEFFAYAVDRRLAPFWLPFGIFTGLVAIVPFFGTLLSTTLPALFVLTGTGYFGFSSSVTDAASNTANIDFK